MLVIFTSLKSYSILDDHNLIKQTWYVLLARGPHFPPLINGKQAKKIGPPLAHEQSFFAIKNDRNQFLLVNYKKSIKL